MNRILPLLLGAAMLAGCSEDDANPGPTDLPDAAADSVASDGTVLGDAATDSGTAETATPETGTDTAMGTDAPVADTGSAADSGSTSDSVAPTDVSVVPDVSTDAVVTDTLVAAVAPAAGEVVISEYLAIGSTLGGATEAGEYVELYNATAKPITLSGCVLKSANGFVVEESPALTAVLAPASYVVLRKESTGVTYDYTAQGTFTGVDFSNDAADHLELSCNNTRIDSVGWRGAAIHPNSGTPTALVARERSTATLGSGPATSITTWCDATTTHTMTGTTSASFKGTPGAPNVCP